MMDKPFGSRLPDVAATVAIALHNNGSYISAQLESLFAQWQPEFELLLIDDRSTDDGFERVLEMLARHPEVCATVMRSETVGGVGLVDSLLRLARGRVIIQADSDDIALPGRLDAVMACFRSDEDCQLVTSNALLLSPEGRLFGLTETRHASRIFRDPVEVAALARDTRWLGAASAYRRDLFDRFPPIDAELCPPALDMLLPFRAVLLGSHHYLAEPLVGWRQHAGNTHRLTVPGDADATQERYHALFLMIQAQKIRDATFIAAAAPSPVLEQALTLCRQRFDEEFEDWCRARTRASARNSQRAASARADFRPGLPPLTTLAVGETLSFAAGEFGAEVLSHHAGFYNPELWGTWTERVAHLSLRVATVPTSITCFKLRIMGHGMTPRQRVRIRVGAEIWTDFEVEQAELRDVDLRCPEIGEVGVVDIVFLLPDAAVPSQQNPDWPDARLIGIGLVSISAVLDSPPSDGSRAVEGQDGEDQVRSTSDVRPQEGL